MEHTPDQVHGFLFEHLDIRGQHLQVESAWQAMIAQRHYPPGLVTLLGELTAMTLLMAKNMKHPGRVTLQVQGQGPVSLLMVEATEQLHLRGVAKTRETLAPDMTDMQSLLGDGKIMMTLENTVTHHLFQSFVERKGTCLQDSFEHYFSQSDQQPTRLWLAADQQRISALLLQKLPEADTHDTEGWDRINLLADTLQPQELQTLPAHTLLHRLFHEETVRVFEPKMVTYHCPRDREKVARMIQSLGLAQARQIIEQEGAIVVHNEVCDFHEKFTLADIEALFDDDVLKAEASRQH